MENQWLTFLFVKTLQLRSIIPGIIKTTNPNKKLLKIIGL
jgi:hypothetical protein